MKKAKNIKTQIRILNQNKPKIKQKEAATKILVIHVYGSRPQILILIKHKLTDKSSTSSNYVLFVCGSHVVQF
jgi:hypothetical protein